MLDDEELHEGEGLHSLDDEPSKEVVLLKGRDITHLDANRHRWLSLGAQRGWKQSKVVTRTSGDLSSVDVLAIAKVKVVDEDGRARDAQYLSAEPFVWGK